MKFLNHYFDLFNNLSKGEVSIFPNGNCDSIARKDLQLTECQFIPCTRLKKNRDDANVFIVVSIQGFYQIDSITIIRADEV